MSNDAFSAAHRAHASTEGLARILPAYPGLAMQRELEALDSALGNPKKPVLGIVGGSKVSTKLDLLNNLVAKLDRLAIGGGMANTFLLRPGPRHRRLALREGPGRHRARDHRDGRRSRAASCCCRSTWWWPRRSRPASTPETRASLGDVQADDLILDAGPETRRSGCIEAMESSKTLIWNGPLGVFEVPPVR